MKQIRIKFGQEVDRQVPTDLSILEILRILGISNKDIVAARINGTLVDLQEKLHEDTLLELVDIHEPAGLEILRHTASHVMAQAVLRLYPRSKLAIGPTIENGFYYDIDTSHTFTPEDLVVIEKEMIKIVNENLHIERIEMSYEAARLYLEEEEASYKLELLDELNVDSVSFYRQGEFQDWCRGPHLPNTGMLKAFTLKSIAGAYWRGDEKRKMLQRIYGTAWAEKEQLKKYLLGLEEAKRRDHRKLAKELDLFSLHDESGAGLVLYHPNGAIIRKTWQQFEENEHLKRGYNIVATPHIYRAELWKISGHYNFYQDNMYFFEADNDEFAVKPMNCPGHVLIYKNEVRSYRDLPLRYFEFGTVYRREKSGVMHGIMRAKGFTQDDAHIFCTPDQLQTEIESVLDFSSYLFELFGFIPQVHLSTQPKHYMGTQDNWDLATDALRFALEKRNIPYAIAEGEGVFYGPKIDIQIRDALDREWQCTTIQVDFNLPEKFDILYTDRDGGRKRAVAVHRALIGSWERFFGILIEHFAGDFPLWISPIQVTILSVVQDVVQYCQELQQVFLEAGFRVTLDDRNEKIGYKIRDAEKRRIKYMVIVGSREVENGTISVRKRISGNLGVMDPVVLVQQLQEEISTKAFS